MAFWVRGRVQSRRIVCLVTLLVSVLAVCSEAAYVYQTRPIQNTLGAPRHRHAAFRLGDGRIGIFSGIGSHFVELFDQTTERFVTSRAEKWFADFGAAVLPDGTVLLVDGERDSLFDYETEQFIPTQNQYTGGYIRFPTMVSLPEGRVFICGGYDIDFEYSTSCGLFDPRSRRFTALGGLVTPRGSHTAILLDDHQVLVAGGDAYVAGTLERVPLKSLELFDTTTGRSAGIRTELLTPRYAHCCVKLPEGRVLIVGGSNFPSNHWLAGTEIFDPKTATISEGPSLGLGRNNARAAVLPSGRIAIFGGNYDSRAIELYCPETGTFELADSLMLDPRWCDFTATNLDAGGVLLAGGRINVDAEGSVLQNAEIFEEVATETPSAPALTAASIRPLLTSQDPNVVDQTAGWLADLGPQVSPILDSLAQDESPELRRLVGSIQLSIEGRDYPPVWCVEIWDASDRLDTVWLDGFECPDAYSPGFPSPLFTSVLRATEGVDLTHLVVRFPAHAPYGARVKLFNLVGWTRIPKVTLGESLSEEELARVDGPVGK